MATVVKGTLGTVVLFPFQFTVWVTGVDSNVWHFWLDPLAWDSGLTFEARIRFVHSRMVAGNRQAVIGIDNLTGFVTACAVRFSVVI